MKMAAVFVWSKGDISNCSENSSQKIPHRIQSLDGLEVQNISCGKNHTLICLQDGSVRICDDKQNGSKSIISNLYSLVQNLPARKVIQVAAGFSHSVILTVDHKVYTWGKNDKGQLGRKNVKKSKRRPKLVESLADYCVIQISCGNDHTLALTNDGLVFLWGPNSYGQLGLGENKCSHSNEPQMIKSLIGIPVLQIVAGGDHSFILSKSGSLYGWGRNDFGQLGLDERENKNLPKRCMLVNDQKIKYVCCGENHTACLTVDGCLLTFGAGSNFQLGHCSNNDEIIPRKVMELAGNEVSQIACGSDHTIAYVPNSGHLYVFGQKGNGHFGLSSTESNNNPFSSSDPFVISSELPLSYFSMHLSNQGSELRIKSIHAGGNKSFIIAMPANTFHSVDYRNEEPSSQLLTLSEERIRILESNPNGKIANEFLNETGKILSSPSCWNGSFLLSNEEHYGCSNINPGVNMNAVQVFFQSIFETKNHLKFIINKIQKILTTMSTSPFDVEALRLFLILPECHVFDKSKFDTSVLCQFAKSFLSLSNEAMEVVEFWWSSKHPHLFKKLVMAYKQCLQNLLQLSYTENTSKNIERSQNLITSLDMLQRLYQVNCTKCVMDDNTFIVPELKNKVMDFSNYPFLFDGETKGILLKNDADFQKKMRQITIVMQSGNFLLDIINQIAFILHIEKENLVNDTFNKLYETNRLHLKLPLFVQFKGVKACGIGVVKEFFLLFFRDVMDPKFDIFTTDDISKLIWFNRVTKQEPKKFYMIGTLCGLMVYNSVAVNLHFPLALYKKLLKRPVTLDDLIELMPVIGISFKSLLIYDDDDFEDNFSLTFECETELCPGGADQMVNQNNKNEYVDLYVDYYLSKSVKMQFDEFSKGFHSICGGEIMDSFHPKELRLLLEGSEDYDFYELEKNAKYGENYSKQHNTIIFFWEVLHEMTLADKKKFLLFLTASDRIPFAGMKDIEITIEQCAEGLPIAFTCYKHLLLPLYTSKAQLKANLLNAIQFCEGFSPDLN